MGRKQGAAVPLSRELGLRLVQCSLSRGLLPYQAVSSSIQPFGHNKHGSKIWGLRPSVREGGAGSPSNTKSPGPRPSSIPSDILIHAAIWPQQMSRKLGAVPLWGGRAGSPSNTTWPRSRPTCILSFILIRLATVHERNRQTDNGLIA